MELINSLIKAVADAGLRDAFYTGINQFAIIPAVLICICRSKKCNISRIKALLIAAVSVALIGQISGLVLWAQTGFQVYGRKNVVAAFAFIPAVYWLAAKLFRVPWRNTCELMADFPLVLHGIYRIACTFAGCCYGYESRWGVYNSYMDQIQIPIQLMESLVSFLIVGYLWHRQKKNAYVCDGRSVPVSLVLYGSARFFLEFLHNEEKLILGCSDISLHCLLMCAEGIVWLILSKRKEQIATQVVES